MWYRFFWLITAALVKPLFKLRAEGMENLPKKTNFIVAANHASYLDPFVLGVVIPQKIYWLAIRNFYNIVFVGWFMKKTETAPVGRASERFIHLLIKNKNVGLFPEGARAPDGRLRKFRSGAALMAFRTGRPVVPCAIIGAYEAWPVSAKFPKFLPIKVRVGKPIYLLKEFEDVIDDIRLQEGTFKIQNAIKEMLYG